MLNRLSFFILFIIKSIGSTAQFYNQYKLIENIDYFVKDEPKVISSDYGIVSTTVRTTGRVTSPVNLLKGDTIVIESAGQSNWCSIGFNKDGNSEYFNVKSLFVQSDKVDISTFVCNESGYFAFSYLNDYPFNITVKKNNKDTSLFEYSRNNNYFLYEVSHAPYIGSYCKQESANSLVIDDNNESIKAYVCYMANPIHNVEMGTQVVITDFYLQEPSARNTNVIFDINNPQINTISIKGHNFKLERYIGDPVICNYDSCYLYLTFRSLIDGKGATVGMFINKSTFTVSDADFIFINGVSVSKKFSNNKIVGHAELEWSGTNIEYYNGYYYRGWRSYERGSSIIRSKDLFNWEIWLFLDKLAPPGLGYDETSLSIDSSGVMYFAVRAHKMIVGKLKIKDKVTLENVVYKTPFNLNEPTRPSIRCFNGNVWVLYNAIPSSIYTNGVHVARANRRLVKLNKDLSVEEIYGGYSPVGGNSEILQMFRNQLFVVLNMNKQSQTNSSTLERCGVYFTPLYSIYNFNDNLE